MDVELSGDYGYIADGDSGLTVVDVSDPFAPEWVSGIHGTADYDGYATDIAVEDQVAYLTFYFDGLVVVDVSNPLDPIELRTYATGGPVFAVAVVGDLAYLAEGSGLRILNVSSPAFPAQVSYLPLSYPLWDVAVFADHAYVAAGPAGFHLIDVSDPELPIEAGYFETGGRGRALSIDRGLAYLADLDDGLWIFAPQVVTGLPTATPFPRPVLAAYPNPFNPQTTVELELPRPATATLSIHDVLGRSVTELWSGPLGSGQHAWAWDGRDARGRPVASGVYFARLATPATTQALRLVLVR
ncbi:MAG: FlgD immunoglobulin-like domain containing protein [Candidatus Krumholzibacteriia bacterium]